MAVASSQYAVQEIFNLTVFDLVDGSCQAVLSDLKNTNWSNNGQVVYAQGGRGNPKIIGFGHSKESTLTCGSAVISDGLFGIQTGTKMASLTSTTLIQYPDTLVVTDETVDTTYTAIGTAGSEIGFAYLINADGSLGTVFEQAGAVSAGHFTYTPGTKALLFNAGDVVDGAKIMVFYYPTASTAKQITNKTDKFAANVKIVADGRFRDTCTGEDYLAQLIYYKAKTSEEYAFDLAADGAPAVHNIKFEALKQCGSTTLWDLFIYDSADLA
jgi:hypothetical protein